MFGASVDYVILRSLAHRRNIATEAELDAAFVNVTDASPADALSKAKKLIARFEGQLPLIPGLRYLDMGCGSGELTVALAELSGGDFTGVDFLPRSIERARSYAAKAGEAANVRFICRDLHQWQPAADERFDVLLSFDAFEHIDAPRAFLSRMADFVADGGCVVLAFGPLFHSPLGDHMWDFFRVQIPWRGLLFPEQVMLRVRRECFRPTDPASRYAEIAGGLNQIRFSDFVADVVATGWEFRHLVINTFLPRGSLSRRLSDYVMKHQVLHDYFAHNVYAVLQRADDGISSSRYGGA